MVFLKLNKSLKKSFYNKNIFILSSNSRYFYHQYLSKPGTVKKNNIRDSKVLIMRMRSKDI